MTIAIYGNYYQDDHIGNIAELLMAMSNKGIDLVIETGFYNYLQSREIATDILKRTSKVEGDDFGADVAVSLGGDGSFLRTAAWVGSKEIPILGINTGHLGYLAEMRLDNPHTLVDDLINGRYRIENRAMIQASCPTAGIGPWPYALNEAALLKRDTASMIAMEAHVNGDYLATYQADGLIISTPTGSTGYNLSVGGPIVAPTAPVWVMSPVAAHSLTMRPLVVGNDSVIAVTTTSRSSSYRLSLDGRSVSLPVGTTVVIRRAPFVTRVVHRLDHNFTDTLRNKLLWGIDKR